MGPERHPTKKVKLITGLILERPSLLPEVKNRLEKAFKNGVDFESPLIDFNHTDYYAEEMGGPLKRVFLSYGRPIDLKAIYMTKLKTNIIEREFCKSGKRSVNIDPGYLDLSKLVLFSTKDYSHRVYLADGIFAEVTLFFKANTFNAWPWTYPDYKSDDYISVFNAIREIYKGELLSAI